MSKTVYARLVSVEATRVEPWGEPPRTDRLEYGEVVLPLDAPGAHLLIRAYEQDIPVVWDGCEYRVATLDVRDALTD